MINQKKDQSQLYKNCDQLLSKIDNMQDLSKAIESFICFMNINNVQKNYLSFKSWTSLIVDKLFYCQENTLPFIIVIFINKCVEFNLINYNQYYILQKYSNLPDYRETLQQQQNVKLKDEDVEFCTIYNKLTKLMQIDDYQYTSGTNVGYSLLTLSGDFVWMDQQSKDIFEIQTLNSEDYNFFDIIIDESKKVLKQKLGQDKRGQIQILGPKKMENKITYVIYSKDKHQKVQNFTKKKGIKKMKNLPNKYFFDLYLKCLVSHLKLVKVQFNLEQLAKNFQRLQSNDNTYFEDKQINKFEDQIQNELKMDYFKSQSLEHQYLIQMSTRIARSVPKFNYDKTKERIISENIQL